MTVTAPFGRDVIETIIPHRDPFLFLDEVLELEPGVRVVARKQVRGDEWFEMHVLAETFQATDQSSLDR